MKCAGMGSENATKSWQHSNVMGSIFYFINILALAASQGWKSSFPAFPGSPQFGPHWC